MISLPKVPGGGGKKPIVIQELRRLEWEVKRDGLLAEDFEKIIAPVLVEHRREWGECIDFSAYREWFIARVPKSSRTRKSFREAAQEFCAILTHYSNSDFKR